MCERIGCTHFPTLSNLNFAGAVAPSRRRFLKGVAAAGTSEGLGQGVEGLQRHDRIEQGVQGRR